MNKNTDLTTTITGLVTSIVGLLTYYNVISMDLGTSIISVGVIIFSWFTNKK